jgi:HEAT repeats
MTMQRLIPKELKYAEDDIMDFTWSHGWILRGKYEADPENVKPFQLRWLKNNDLSGLHYIDDFVVGFPYYVLKGNNLEEEFKRISEAIELYSIEDILTLLHDSSDSESRRKGILYLGVSITEEFRKDIFSEFLNAFSDPNTEVRKAAIKACTYIGWREFCEVLERMKTRDSDPEVCFEAEATFEAFDC